jgi:hypothetical protein
MNGCIHLRTTGKAYFYSTIFEKRPVEQRFLTKACNRLLQRIAFPLISTHIGTSSEPGVTGNFELSPLETYHVPSLERVNSRTGFAACSNGGAAAIIYLSKTLPLRGRNAEALPLSNNPG